MHERNRLQMPNQELIQSCKACNQGDVLFTEAHDGLPPTVACSNCFANYAHLKQIGWIDAKFREHEQAQDDLVRMYLSEVLQRLTHEELTELYAEGWVGDVMNVVVKLRPAGKAGPVLEICHDLTRAAERAYGVVCE